MTHYNEYEPEKKIINKIKKHLDGVSVKSFIELGAMTVRGSYQVFTRLWS